MWTFYIVDREGFYSEDVLFHLTELKLYYDVLSLTSMGVTNKCAPHFFVQCCLERIMYGWQLYQVCAPIYQIGPQWQFCFKWEKQMHCWSLLPTGGMQLCVCQLRYLSHQFILMVSGSFCEIRCMPSLSFSYLPTAALKGRTPGRLASWVIGYLCLCVFWECIRHHINRTIQSLKLRCMVIQANKLRHGSGCCPGGFLSLSLSWRQRLVWVTWRMTLRRMGEQR